MNFVDSRVKRLLSKKNQQIITQGLNLLTDSKDPAHGIKHVRSMWDLYFAFKRDHPDLKIDDKVMVQAIVFHDVWKAQAERSKHFLKVLFEEYFEGSWSADIYKKYAAKMKIDSKIIKKVAYAITKHSTGTLLPRRSTEAKLLFDLDEIEFFNFDRFKKAFRNFKFGVDRQILATRSYFNLRSKRGFYFDWSNSIFKKRKNKFLAGLKKLKKEL